MGAKKAAAILIALAAIALIGIFFFYPEFFENLGLFGKKGIFELGFSSNQLALLGTDAGASEAKKMDAIKENFFVFEFGDEQKKQVAEREKLQIKQGSFKTAQGIGLEGWILRIPNIEKGKDYEYEIRIPNYEIAKGSFTAKEVLDE